MKIYERKHILPAIMRAGMYTGEQGERTKEEWYADAVAEVLNATQELELRQANTGADGSVTVVLTD